MRMTNKDLPVYLQLDRDYVSSIAFEIRGTADEMEHLQRNQKIVAQMRVICDQLLPAIAAGRTVLLRPSDWVYEHEETE